MSVRASDIFPRFLSKSHRERTRQIQLECESVGLVGWCFEYIFHAF
jgi:hypothetical protein